MPFLNQIIERILDDRSVPLHEVAVILPNRRARRLLLQSLHQANGGKPMFAPEIFPMEEFVAWLSPLKVLDPVTQLLRLHELTRNFPGDRFSTHQLLTWGVAFLKDISDMDMQLQDVPACLREFADAAKFEIPFGKEEMSESERERLQFNDLLADIYLQYRELLQSRKESYEGMIYRDCAEHIAEYSRKLPFRRLIFAGFYALSPSELEIIRYFQEHCQTEFYVDIDLFYCHIEEELHLPYRERKTSFFITRNCEKLHLDTQKLLFNEEHFSTIPKKVSIVSTAKNMRQIYGAIREVERIRKEKMAGMGVSPDDKSVLVDMSDTAVVLADEHLLLPFLLSYQPDNVKINATMGFPFESTPVYNILMQAMAVYESVFALTPDKANELMFSGEDMERLWDHEVLRAQKPSPFYFPTVIHYSQIPNSEAFVNLPKTEIARQLPSVLRRFCIYAESVTSERLYRELWSEVILKLTDLQALFDRHFTGGDEVDFPFAKFAVVNAVHNIAISIQGDPDMGLQVMGLLETRMMDFRNVVMLSVNEGVLPKGLTYNSLLPFDFKYKFDGQEALPNYLYQDQVYAYHFFRLLQRAENVTLIYNNASDVNLAEKSRLISQLEYEVDLQRLGDVVEIRHQNLDFLLNLPERTPLSVPKTDELIQLLRDFRFSATSLQAFIACPLKFYLQYLMRIRETPLLSDHLEYYELGTVIHAVYKLAFDEIRDEPDPAKYGEILQQHIAGSDAEICREIRQLPGRESLTDKDLEQGYWLINRKILGETVNKYLNRAKQEFLVMPWKITANEMGVDIRDYQIVPPDGSQPFTVRLTGSLDRVQHIGRDVMILDYKTGKVEEPHLRAGVGKASGADALAVALEQIFTDRKFDKLFQLALYTLMYERVAKEKPSSVQVNIISTQAVNRNNPKYMIPGLIMGETDILQFSPALSERLNRLFCEIFDPSVPFTQTADAETCKYCVFLHLCGRQTPTESRV